MKTNFEHSEQLNKDIKSIAKRNGMKKEEWVVWALTEMVRQVQEVEKKIASRTPEETQKILDDRDKVHVVPDELKIRMHPITDVVYDGPKSSSVLMDEVGMTGTPGEDHPDGPKGDEPDYALQNQEIIGSILGTTEVKEFVKEKTDELVVKGSTSYTDQELKQTIQPLDENGQQSIPSYTFYMTDGSEQKVEAKSKDDAAQKLGLSEDDYFDYKVTE